MRILILEGIVTALTAIMHNGGEKQGNVSLFRRQGFAQPNGKFKDVPIISGNGIRGIFRRVAGKLTLDFLGEDGKPLQVPPTTAQTLFSGGALSQTDVADNVGFLRDMRQSLTPIAVFGTSYGNAMVRGKLKVNPLVPICKETAHVIPEKFYTENLGSCHSLLQLEMFTRKTVLGDTEFVPYIRDAKDAEKQAVSEQMIYHVETLKAGTQFYWKCVLENVTAEEFDLFLTMLERFNAIPVVGGKGSIGFGQISLASLEWRDVSKVGETLSVVDRDTKSMYAEMLASKKDAIKNFLVKM